MKKITIIKIFSFILVTVFIFTAGMSGVAAAPEQTPQEKSSQALVKLQLMKGDQFGNLNLQNKLTRAEFLTLAVRMLGYENSDAFKDVKVEFKDITQKHWAYNSTKTALGLKLVTGYTDGTFRPDSQVTFTEARAILIRALGYEKTLKGTWPANVLEKSAELGLNKDLNVPDNRELTRGEASVLIYNSLTVNILS